MGSLSSRPEIPAKTVARASQIVTRAPVVAVTSAVQGTQHNAPQSDKERREKNLLRRNRGRLGTIKTGFRGFLSRATLDKPRKTLLGE